VTFARGPIAPHPEHITTTDCVCSDPDVATVKFSLAQKGQGRKLMVGIWRSVGDDTRHSRKVLAVPAAGPTDGCHKGCAVVGVRDRPCCTSFTSTSRLIPLSGRRSKHGRYANAANGRRLEVRVLLRAVRELIDGA
jgi:hypothetical protein